MSKLVALAAACNNEKNRRVAHLPDRVHDNAKKVVRKARHRYERPSVLLHDMNAKHNRNHHKSRKILMFTHVI